MMKLYKQSNSLYVAKGEITSIGSAEINILKNALNESVNGRVRINMHSSQEDLLHEMFIIIAKNTYIRPHKHLDKSEAFHMVHGSMKVVIFKDNGEILKVVSLDNNRVSNPFYYRLSSSYFHTVLLESDFVIIHEITNGPFIKENTLYAPFAPSEIDKSAIEKYQDHLQAQLSRIIYERLQ